MKENMNESLIPVSLPMMEFSKLFQKFLNPKEILGIRYWKKPDKALEQKIRHSGHRSAFLRQGDIGTEWFIVDHNVEGLDWSNKIPDEAKYDLIFGDFPFGLNKVDYLDIKDNLIAKALTYLSDDGHAIFLTTTKLAQKLKERLPNSGFNVHAIMKTPNSFPALYGITIEICLVVVSKEVVDRVFYAELPDSVEDDCIYLMNNLLSNYFEKMHAGNLRGGMTLPVDYHFLSFRGLNALSEIAKLQTLYLEFKGYDLGQLAIEVNAGQTGKDFVEKNNSIYIPRVGNGPVISLIAEGTMKHQNYHQIVLKDNALNEYICCFYRSQVGKLSLETVRQGAILSITKSALLKLPVALPKIETQNKIVAINETLDNLQDNLDVLKEELAVNPMNVSNMSAIDDIASIIKGFTTSDNLRSLILGGESKVVEFKETFSLDLESKQKKKFMEHSSLKAIAGFLNANGGKLFIGVNDSQEISGIDEELKKFYKGSHDNYLLHFKNCIDSHISLKFSDYIEYNIEELDGKKILLVVCSVSPEPCFLKKDFFMRTNPATVKLEGEEQYQYIKNHFKKG